MRDWVGIDTASLPPSNSPEFQTRARKMFGDIDYFLRDLSRGIGRIQNGETPDGSGNPIGGPALDDFFFLPGRSGGQIGHGDTVAAGTLTLHSTINTTRGFINLGDTTYIDEANNLVGINVAAPAAALHLFPGISGTTTLNVSGNSGAANWDGSRNAAEALTGNPVYSGVTVNDDSTEWSGVNSGSLGVNPQGFAMNGTIIPDRVWSVSVRVSTLSGTASNSGDLEFRINDANGDQFVGTGFGTSGAFAADMTGLTTTWVTKTFTIDTSGTPVTTGQTANSIVVGLVGYNGVPGPVTSLYIRCTYIEMSTGGDSSLVRWDNSSGTKLGGIDSAGRVGINTATASLSAALTAIPIASTTIGAIVKGAASQTGDLMQWQNSSGTPLTNITSAGDISGGTATTDSLILRSNSFNTSVARITLTDTTDVIFDVPSGSVDPMTLSMGLVSGTLTGTSLTMNLVDTGGNNSTISVDNRGGGASAVPLAIYRATIGSTANLTEWRDEVAGGGNAILSRIKSDGTFVGPIASTSAVSVVDNVFSILDNLDNTKIAQFQCATIGAGTTKTFTFPNASGTLPTLENAHTVTGGWLLGTLANQVAATIDGTTGAYTGLGFALYDVNSGFFCEFGANNGAGFSANRMITFPDANGILMTTLATQSMSNKTLSTTGNALNCNVAATGVAFQDSGTTAKKLRFIMSGAFSGNNSITISTTTAAKNYTFPDANLNMIGRVATSDLTTQGAAIAATTIYAVPAEGQGFYQVSWMATVTRAATTSSVLGGTNGFQVVFTDPNDSVVKTSAPTTVTAFTSAGNATGTSVSGVFCAYCKASTNLQYSFDYTSVGGTTMQYDLSIRVTYIG